eukprot:15210469-Heterocapsa_arctica.AAC.1
MHMVFVKAARTPYQEAVQKRNREQQEEYARRWKKNRAGKAIQRRIIGSNHRALAQAGRIAAGTTANGRIRRAGCTTGRQSPKSIWSRSTMRRER